VLIQVQVSILQTRHTSSYCCIWNIYLSVDPIFQSLSFPSWFPW